jgi:hypothetical protein
MFDFINRFSKEGIIIYQWERITAKQTLDAQKSILWFNECKDFREFSTKIYSKEIKFNVPVSDVIWTDITVELKTFLYNIAKSKKIDDLLIRIWW